MSEITITETQDIDELLHSIIEGARAAAKRFADPTRGNDIHDELRSLLTSIDSAVWDLSSEDEDLDDVTTVELPAFAGATLNESLTITCLVGWRERVEALAPFLVYGPSYDRRITDTHRRDRHAVPRRHGESRRTSTAT